jgi:hypothetical protein
MKSAIAFVTLAILAAFVASSAEERAYPIRVSLIQLIATPDKFDGKLVSTSGFLSVDREATLLYLDQESHAHHLEDNAIWFFLNEDLGKNREKFNQNYVVMVGVFRNQRKGAGTNPNGGIDPVRTCAQLSLGSAAASRHDETSHPPTPAQP